jgi:DNA helicase TIP49 (TBP-interacting protein)
LTYALKKEGMTTIEGGYLTGKTTLTIAIAKALLTYTKYINMSKDQDKQEKKRKTYTIAELMR